jgi:NAD(P)-dependent dehydrogenase (short-subunit alcohol dehydrogenase family)
MGLYVVSGSASGIGAATRAHLEARGDEVIGVDLAGQDVSADLSQPSGRADALAALRPLCGRQLSGLVVAAGLGASHPRTEEIIAVNYFGCVALLDGLRDLLVAGNGAAVALSSNTALSLPDFGGPLEEVCLGNREAEALTEAAELEGPRCYVSSKRALIRYVRREAPGWMRAGARLNAIAPGPVRTPLLTRDLAHETIGPRLDEFPVPAGGPAEPSVIADAIAFLLDHPFCCGTVLCVDGGGDSELRPDAI